jgi:L-threonylcarbamoyladenylate synthase
MPTQIIPLETHNSIEIAAEMLKSGDVIAVPTDTVYGIACLSNNSQAISSLYDIKIRDSLKAIPVLISDLEQLSQISGTLSPNAEKLALAFWPGSLTLVVPKGKAISPALTSYDTIGVRIPDHDWLRTLIRKAGPLAATSANISGQPSPTIASEVLNQLKERIPAIFDGGTCKLGVSSTVVDCSTDDVKILRQGGIAEYLIYKALE